MAERSVVMGRRMQSKMMRRMQREMMWMMIQSEVTDIQMRMNQPQEQLQEMNRVTEKRWEVSEKL